MLAPAELIGALNEAPVEFIVIGGFAVAAHGFPRATKDIDIVPSPDPENLVRLATVLRELDARVDGLGDFASDEFPHDPHDPQALREGGNFVLQTRLRRLDIMQWVPGIESDLAYEQRLAARRTSRTSAASACSVRRMLEPGTQAPAFTGTAVASTVTPVRHAATVPTTLRGVGGVCPASRNSSR